MSTSFRRWDAKKKEASEWKYYELDPELFVHDGNCSVYISREKLDGSRPSFRVPFSVLVSANCLTLIQEAAIVLPEPSAQQSTSDTNPSAGGSLIRGPHYSLCLEAPDFYSNAEVLQYHITTRNLFAWVMGKPVVGISPATALSALKIRLDAWRPSSEDNFVALSVYATDQGYCDDGGLQNLLSDHLQSPNAGRHGYKLVEVPSQPGDDRRGRRRDSFKESLRAIRRSLSRPRAKSTSSTVRSLSLDNAEARMDPTTSDIFSMSGGVGTRPSMPTSRHSTAKSVASIPSSTRTNTTTGRRSSFLGIPLGRARTLEPVESPPDDPPMFVLPDIRTRTISDISSELESASSWIESIYRQHNNNNLNTSNADIPTPLKIAREEPTPPTVSTRSRPSATPRSIYSYTKAQSTTSRAPSPIEEEDADTRKSNIPPVPARSAARLSLTISSRNDSATSLHDCASVHETDRSPTVTSPGTVRDVELLSRDVQASADARKGIRPLENAKSRTPTTNTLQPSSDTGAAELPGHEVRSSNTEESHPRKASNGGRPSAATSGGLISRFSWAPKPSDSDDLVSAIDDSSKRQTWYADPVIQTGSPTEIFSSEPRPLKSAMKAAEVSKRQIQSSERAPAKANVETGRKTAMTITRFPSLKRAVRKSTTESDEVEPASPQKYTLRGFPAPSPRSVRLHANASEPNLTTAEQEARRLGQTGTFSRSVTSLAEPSRGSSSATQHRCRKGHVLPAYQEMPLAVSAAVPHSQALKLDTTEGGISRLDPASNIEAPMSATSGTTFSLTENSTPATSLPSSDSVHSTNIVNFDEPSKRVSTKSVSIAITPTSNVNGSKIRTLKAQGSTESLQQCRGPKPSPPAQSSYFLPRPTLESSGLGTADLSAIDQILSEIEALKQLAALDGPQEDRERLVRFDSIRRGRSKLKQEATSKVPLTADMRLAEKKKKTKTSAASAQAQTQVTARPTPSSFSGSPKPSSPRFTTPVLSNASSSNTSFKHNETASGDGSNPAVKGSARKLKKQVKKPQVNSVRDVQASILSFSDYEKYLSKAASGVGRRHERTEQGRFGRSNVNLYELAS